MFDSLGKKLQGVVRQLSGQGTISEKNVQDALRDVRLALLEADVHFKVVKDFVAHTKERAMGAEVLTGVNPGQQFIKIVYDELTETMGGQSAHFDLDRSKINVVMLLGLQGSGKTTFAAKLAKHLMKDNWKPMLVACDIYRPAAVKQLKTVGSQVGVPVFEMGTENSVVMIARGALKAAAADSRDVMIIDTAGRLHIDEMKMDELVGLRDQIKPRFTFLVADAMTGQDAVNSAGTFHTQIGIDGVCLTKLDGDARGGAALSIKVVTGRPIFSPVWVSDWTNSKSFTRPNGPAHSGYGRRADSCRKGAGGLRHGRSRGDARKIRKESFTFDDFLKQMKQMKKMGSISKLMKFIPGLSQVMDQVDEGQMEKEMGRTEAIIHSMTLEERNNPALLNGARRARIAKGAGTTVPEINKLVKEFEMARRMMKEMMGGGLKGLMGGGGGDGAAARPVMHAHGSGKGKAKSKKELKKLGKLKKKRH